MKHLVLQLVLNPSLSHNLTSPISFPNLFKSQRQALWKYRLTQAGSPWVCASCRHLCSGATVFKDAFLTQ